MTSTPDPTVDSLPLGALCERMGVRLIEARKGRVVATMPVEGNTQPFGLLNGGASAVLAETLGSIAAALHAGPGRYPVGLDLNCTHHRGVREGFVTAVATPLSEGRTIASYDIRVSDQEGRAICSARLTCLIRDLESG